MQVHDAIFYNLFIRYVLTSTLKIQVAVCTTLMVISWSGIVDITQGVIACLLMFALSVAPIVTAVCLYRSREKLFYCEFERKFGSIYQGIRVYEKSIYALSYPVVFFLRRTIFVILMFILISYPTVKL